MHNPIIVIGAGMAGLAAANTLKTAGRQVIILEARDRIGGRTYTDNSLGASLDQGASWIHGQQGNPMTQLAEEFGLTSTFTHFDNQNGDALMVFDNDGAKVDVAEYTAGVNRFWQAYRSAIDNRLYMDGGPKISVADALNKGLPGEEKLTPTERLGYNSMGQIRLQYLENTDPGHNSWRLGTLYAGYPGGDMLLHGGFGKIAEGLAADLDIRLGQQVRQIRYGGKGVEVHTASETFSAHQQ